MADQRGDAVGVVGDVEQQVALAERHAFEASGPAHAVEVRSGDRRVDGLGAGQGERRVDPLMIPG